MLLVNKPIHVEALAELRKQTVVLVNVNDFFGSKLASFSLSDFMPYSTFKGIRHLHFIEPTPILLVLAVGRILLCSIDPNGRTFLFRVACTCD